MKLRMVVVLLCALVAFPVYAAEKSSLKTDKEKLSYAIGANYANRAKNEGIDIDPDSFAKGLKDAYTGGKLLLTEQEMKGLLASFEKELAAKQQERFKKLAEKNKKEGEAFLADNKKKEGVKTLESGLQYKVIKEGTGNSPKASDSVVTIYRGTFINGKEFGSTKQGQPEVISVNNVIPGMREALQLMKEGSRWQIFVPSNLAYGERGRGNVIGPNSTLIFDIELVSIKESAKKDTDKKDTDKKSKAKKQKVG